MKKVPLKRRVSRMLPCPFTFSLLWAFILATKWQKAFLTVWQVYRLINVLPQQRCCIYYCCVSYCVLRWFIVLVWLIFTTFVYHIAYCGGLSCFCGGNSLLSCIILRTVVVYRASVVEIHYYPVFIVLVWWKFITVVYHIVYCGCLSC